MSARVLKPLMAALVLAALVPGTAPAVTVTNLYHTNRVFRLLTNSISGTPSVYQVRSMAGDLTQVIGPTNVIVHTNNTFAREYEAVAWRYPSSQAAWTGILATYVTHYQTYTNHTYDNVGWIKGTREAYTNWGAFLWLMQNQVDFKTSETNIWISPYGVTNYIVKVMVASLGDYPPMTNVVDVGPTNVNGFSFTNYPGSGVSTEMVCKADFRTYYELLVVNMVAHRPATENPYYGQPFAKRDVPESQEESPGVGIRVNGDDDNHNSTEDRNDTTVDDENDLIEVRLEASSNPLNLKYILKRNNSNIKVWTSRNKGTALLDANNETNLTFDIPWKTVWVEGPSGGNADLELEARTDPGNVLIRADKVHFYPFTSIVVVLGGNDQVPTDPPVPNAGVFMIGTNLYADGYDVHMYASTDVSGDGSGAPYDEVVRSVQSRSVSSVAVVGYSYGGDAAFVVANRLNNNRGSIGTFTISYSAYIDAVQRDFPAYPGQTNRPPSSLYHVNYYQMPHELRDSWLGGEPMVNPPGADVELNVQTQWDTNIVHYYTGAPPDHSIDNNVDVMDGVLTSLRSNVLR